MSKVNGRMVTCDICGKTVFCRLEATGEADGGWSKWEKYEEPAKWRGRREGFEDVCDECNEALDMAIGDTVKWRAQAKEEHDA